MMLCCSEACAQRAARFLLVADFSEGGDQGLVRRRDAFKGGNRIDLTALEFSLDQCQPWFRRGEPARPLGLRPGLDQGLGLGRILGTCRRQRAPGPL